METMVLRGAKTFVKSAPIETPVHIRCWSIQKHKGTSGSAMSNSTPCKNIIDALISDLWSLVQNESRWEIKATKKNMDFWKGELAKLGTHGLDSISKSLKKTFRGGRKNSFLLINNILVIAYKRRHKRINCKTSILIGMSVAKDIYPNPPRSIHCIHTILCMRHGISDTKY